MTKLSRAVFSRKTDDWGTPRAVFAELDDEFHFTDDPCPLGRPEPLLGGLADGLSRKWGERVFCNPPYSNIAAFLEKGRRSMEASDSEIIVFLLPARTDTTWFHEAIIDRAEIRFIRGRLRFGDAENTAPFPSMIVIFR